MRIKKMNWDLIKQISGIAVPVLGVLTAIAVLINYHAKNKVEERKARFESNNGELLENKSPLAEMEILNKKYGTDLNDNDTTDLDGRNIVVIWGTSVSFYEKGIPSESLTKTPIRINGKALFKIRIVNNKLLVSTVVRSFDGKIIAEIQDNNWSTNANQVLKKNYDDNALEVIDEYGIVVIQIIMENPSVIVIQGALSDGEGYVFLNKNGMRTVYFGLPDDQFLKTMGSNKLEFYQKIGSEVDRIFEYKGEKSQGKRINL